MQVPASARLLRSSLVAACTVALAAGAHVAGGGTLPALSIVVALAVLTLLPVTVLAGRQLSLRVLGGLLVGGQVVLHGVFEMFASGQPCINNKTGGGAGGLGHGLGGSVGAISHHAATPVDGVCASSTAGAMVPHVVDAGASLGIVIAHGVAAVLVVAMMHRGESAFWQLLAWLRPLAQLPPSPVTVGWPQVAAYREDVSVPRAWRNIRFDVRRGPPAGLVLRSTLA